MNMQDLILKLPWERTPEDDLWPECQECGEPCRPEDDLCALCYLMIAPIEGTA